MLPLVELRLAIPAGVALQLPLYQVFIISIIGNMLPIPFILFFSRKILLWGKDKRYTGKLFSYCINKGTRAGQKLTRDTKNGIFAALILFIGIPIPGTGAWTGALAASVLGLDFKRSVLSCLCGILLAAVIMAASSYGVFSLIRPF